MSGAARMVPAAVLHIKHGARGNPPRANRGGLGCASKAEVDISLMHFWNPSARLSLRAHMEECRRRGRERQPGGRPRGLKTSRRKRQAMLV